MPGSKFSTEIMGVLIFKVLGLALLYFLFFGPSHRTKITPDGMAAMLVQKPNVQH